VTDYKKYALGQVENFLYDAMSTDATPQEIYDVIKGVVEDNYYTYKKCASEAYELLALLNGNGNGHLTCDKNDTSQESKKSWNDFWEENYYPEEHSEHYYDYGRNKPVTKTYNKDDTELMPDLQYTEEELNAMCAAAEVEQDLKNAKEFLKEDKVKKWILPVEETKVSETDETEYFITFPDDLLEAANLKEGDQVEWIDNYDGSYTIRHKIMANILNKQTQPSWVEGNELAKVKTYQEMIDDGWTMTDDGFWIKEN
jgi:bifunctional DNA-binding transcriptional regulator/antitoxin component of YhaV-PrlF toxin-antitoxin module